VGRDFDCRDNQLISLQGSPQRVGWDFNCDDERLKQEYQKMKRLEQEYQKMKRSNSGIKLKNAVGKLIVKMQHLLKSDSRHDI
jgi:hypothetical protein